MLTPNRALQRGFPTTVAESVDAADTDEVRAFSVLGVPGALNTVKCQVTGTFVAFSGNLEASLDGQTSWSTFLAFDFLASEIFIFDASPGVSYRFNPSTVTTPVSLGIEAVLT